VSHYEVLEPLGEGGMGVVHKGRDLRLGRLVALKFLSPALLGSPEARARFLREARSLSSLSHPNVATVYEVDEAGGVPFLAMEFLPGGTLRARIRRASHAPIPWSDVAAWAAELASGLAHAHAKGIVHRDVKSSNVMFDEQGRLRLTDFGLAKAPGGPEVTATGETAGTVAYMSPERLEGREADARSDLFALGVVLYEALTGLLPFRGESPATMMHGILNLEPPPPSELRPGVPPELDRIVLRLLAKAPDDRYPAAADLLGDLRQLTSDAILADRVPTKTAVRVRRRLRRRVVIAAVAPALLLAAAVGLWLQPPAEIPGPHYVAVIPLEIVGGDTELQAFGDGLVDRWIAALDHTGHLSVATFLAVRDLERVDAARRELGVNLVIHGRLERRGDQLALDLRLTDARGQILVGSRAVEGPIDRLAGAEHGVADAMEGLLARLAPEAGEALRLSFAGRAGAAVAAYLRGYGFLVRADRGDNLDRAIAAFESATRRDDGFGLAHVGLAEANLAQYRRRREERTLTAARAAAQRALAVEPRCAAAHVLLGTIQADSGQTEAAIRHLETALELDPREPAAYREMARVFEPQKRLAEAEAVLQQAVRQRPGDWRSHADLGRFYSRQKRDDVAEMLYRKVVELTPDNHVGYRNLGGLYTNLGRYEEAETMLKKAIDLKPTAVARSNLGTFYMLRKRYADAVPVMEVAARQAATERPDDYLIWGNLGDAYWLSGAPESASRPAYRRAVDIAERLLAQAPDDADHLGLVAEYHAKLGDRARAVERITGALRAAPEDASPCYQAARVYALLGDAPRAIDYLRTARDRGVAVSEMDSAPELASLHADPGYRKLVSQSR
jgi:serine/threonine-protein kinase